MTKRSSSLPNVSAHWLHKRLVSAKVLLTRNFYLDTIFRPPRFDCYRAKFANLLAVIIFGTILLIAKLMNESSKVVDMPLSSTWRWFPLCCATVVFAIFVVGIAYASYISADILIVLSLSVLFAIFLTKSSEWLQTKTSIPYKYSLSIVTLALLGLIVGSTWLFGSRMANQLSTASTQLDRAKEQLRESLNEAPYYRVLIEEVPFGKIAIKQLGVGKTDDSTSDSTSSSETKTGKNSEVENSNTSETANETTQPQARENSDAIKQLITGTLLFVRNMLQSSLGVGLNALIIFFVGIFLAAAPSESRDGVSTFCPPKRRARCIEILNILGDTLWRWLIGRFATMLITGLGVGIALALLGVPLAGMFGFVTGVLTFIPNIGGTVSLVLAMFVALPSGVSTVGWVLGIYVIFQLIESYVITPLIQQYQVDVPPALLIAVQAIIGVLFGFLGVMVASPILVVLMVLHRELYRNDLFGEQV